MQEITFKSEEPSILIILDKEGNEILKFEPNGDVFYKGKLIQNDKQITGGFIEFLKGQGYW